MNRIENNSKPVQVDGANFDSEVLQSKMPVLVALLASWSRPCAILDPVLDEIASECSGKLKVARVNADGNLDLSLQYDVRSVPTLLYFVSGNVRAKIVGTATKEAILSKLESTRKVS
jgi:thioredoxin 1